MEILIAGPGDVIEERQEIARAIDTWNRLNAHHVGLVMQPVMWETDTFPELGSDSQAIINKQLAGRCDAVIAVFATRLGTTTPRGASGTAEEIDRFEAEGKPVAVYFSAGRVDVEKIDVAQLQALRDYKLSLRERGLYRSYESVADLRHLVDQYLTGLGYRFQAPQEAREPQQVGARTDFHPTETDMKVIAVVGREMVETGKGHVNALYLQEEPELSGISQDAIFESLRVLKSVELMIGAETIGQSRWEVGLTSNGLEMWLLHFEPNYDRMRHQIAMAIAKNDIRNPALIPNEAGVTRVIVEHVLQRWAARRLVILNNLYGGIRIDRFSEEIQRLADEAIYSVRSDATRCAQDRTQDQGPHFRVVDSPIGVDVVALSDFGGELGDPVAAAIKVDGWTVVQVVTPEARSTWEAQVEEEFRTQVRRLATSHDLLGRRGEVRILFDPPQASAEKRDESGGEPVERK